MAFEGCGFAFDGIPAAEFGLELYEFGSNTQGDTPIASTGEILSQQVEKRHRSYLYGVAQNKPLEFKLVFGVNRASIHAHKPLDRWDIQAITAWLTGHDDGKWKWLEIEQPDLETVRYRCLISELTPISEGLETWAFSCRVTCDSPFGYTYPETYVYRLAGEPKQILLYNRSSFHGDYYPRVELLLNGGDGASIVNESDGNRKFLFSGLNALMPLTLTVDNETQIIKSDRLLPKPAYSYFNLNFFRLKRGDNVLTLNGRGIVKIICEFPVNAGG